MKRFLGTAIAVAAVIAVIDMVLHNVILMDAYKQTMHLWRFEAEIKDLFGLILAGLLVNTVYNMMAYVVMPLPAAIPVAWFLGGMAECVAAGTVAGMIYKPQRAR